jgi:tryptophanyl-tRNA synthetase
VAEAVVEFLRPVREAYPEIRADEAGLEAALTAGAGRARDLAAVTLTDVRTAMGVGPN